MDFTFELGKIYNIIPFEIMKQDKDEVIMMLNYMVEKSETAQPAPHVQNAKKQQYIKVNSKTATGGWW